MIFAVDPGNEISGYVLFDGHVRESGVLPNSDMIERLKQQSGVDYLAIEMIASYGMPVGREVFETCVWIGRFMQQFGSDFTRLIYRRDVKLHLCSSARAKDANIRQALIDKFGGTTAIGKKATPGPLYGVKSHAWAALAVAVTANETARMEHAR